MPIYVPQEFITAMRSPIKELKIKLEFYDSKMNYISELTKNVTKADIGGISVDANRPVRRSFSFGLSNLKNNFDWGDNELVWIDKRVKLYTGLKTHKQDTIYIPQGVFIVSEPVNTHDMSGKMTLITGQDKAWLMTDKRGKFVDEQTIETGTDIVTAIKLVAGKAGETMFLFDPVTEKVPFELVYASSDNRWKAIQELAEFAKCEIFYDENGYLRLKKIETDIDLEPTTWLYEYGGNNERFYAGNKRRFDESELANHIRVLGGSGQTATVMYDLVVDESIIQDTFEKNFSQQSEMNGVKENVLVESTGKIVLDKGNATIDDKIIDTFEVAPHPFNWSGDFQKNKYSAKDGELGLNLVNPKTSTATMSFTDINPTTQNGNISFWYNYTGDDNNYTALMFTVAGTTYRLSNTSAEPQGWKFVTFPVPASTGTKTFKWMHQKGNLLTSTPSFDNVTYIRGTKQIVGYKPKGRYDSLDFAFTGFAKDADSIRLEWDESVPAGTNLKVETSFSINSGTTWSNWKDTKNGEYIASFSNRIPSSQIRVKYRVYFETSDLTKTPALNSMKFLIGTSMWANHPYSIQRIGRVLYEHNNGSPDPLLTTVDECKWRAKWELMKRLGYAERVTLDLAPNWIHDAGDVIQIEDQENKVTGKYKISSFQLPLNIQMMSCECYKYVKQIKDWNFI